VRGRRPDPLAVREKVTTMQAITVPFHNETLLAAPGHYADEGDRPIPLRPFCDRLGVSMQGQLAKLSAEGKAWTCVKKILMQIPGDDQTREVACLPLRSIPMWLATIHSGKVKPDVRPMLDRYQAEAADVLYKHFLGSNKARGITAEQMAEVAAHIMGQVGKILAPVLEAQQKTAEAIAQIQAQVIALHRDHNNARDMSAIGSVCAKTRIKAPIVRIAKEKARHLGGKKSEASFNRKFHIRLREACGGFAGPWDRLPRDLLGTAETCVANIEREVRADTLIAERQGGYSAQQLRIDERNQRPN